MRLHAIFFLNEMLIINTKAGEPNKNVMLIITSILIGVTEVTKSQVPAYSLKQAHVVGEKPLRGHTQFCTRTDLVRRMS